MYRIAFFGSDLFSLASFRAVLALHRSRPDLVRELTLVTRELKASGRGMKQIVKPPIVEFAELENVPWREVETEEQFRPLSEASNLAVAVSYGRLIPAEYLKRLQFGGLNVHPSFLPQYRGSSPLQWAIMDQSTATGVSVQTLHPTKFDHGAVLWRSPAVPLAPRETTPSLSAKLAEVGAAGLCEVIKNADLSAPQVCSASASTKPSLAPKPDRSLHRIDFAQSASRLDARGRALGKLFFEQRVAQAPPKRGGKPKGHPVLRVNLAQFCPVAPVAESEYGGVGDVARGSAPDGTPLLCLRVRDAYLGAAEVTVQGFKRESAASYFEQRDKRKLRDVVVSDP